MVWVVPDFMGVPCKTAMWFRRTTYSKILNFPCHYEYKMLGLVIFNLIYVFWFWEFSNLGISFIAIKYFGIRPYDPGVIRCF